MTRVEYNRDSVCEEFLYGGETVVGFCLWIRFGRCFPSALGEGEPEGAAEMNSLVRVSFNPGTGLIILPDPSLDAIEVYGWSLFIEDSEGTGREGEVQVSRAEWEQLLNAHGMTDWLWESIAYRLSPCVGAESVHSGVGEA